MLIAIDGSWDNDAQCGGWAVALCRRLIETSGSPPRLGGVDARSGSVPQWVDAAHGCEAWALLTALRWTRRLKQRPDMLITDCAALEELLAGARIPGLRTEDLSEIRHLARQADIPLIRLGSRAARDSVHRDLHARAHRDALRAMRNRRTTLAEENADR